MKRRIPGLHRRGQNGNSIPDGMFLARVDRVFYNYHPQKPFLFLRFLILKPQEFTGRSVSGRIYCTPRALWKLNWFLHDFGYDSDLLDRDEVDEKALIGLQGILKISRTSVNGRSFLNLAAFAQAGKWEELCQAQPSPGGES